MLKKIKWCKSTINLYGDDYKCEKPLNHKGSHGKEWATLVKTKRGIYETEHFIRLTWKRKLR